MGLSRRELKEHEMKMRRIRLKGERKLLKDELKQERRKYWPRPKLPSASKLALGYMFISCTAVEIFSMVAMWHYGDLSPLYSLIGAAVAEAISYCAYSAKSAKENTKGGIVYDVAIKGQQEAQESPQGEEKAQG